MKIAMMVRGYVTAPGPSDIVYAPIDLAITICKGLVKRGHQVDFYGPEGTRLKSPVKTRGLKPLVTNQKEFQALLDSVDLFTHYVPGLWDQYLSSEMFCRAEAGEYDLLHFHHPEIAMPYARFFPKVKVVYTLHDPIYKWYLEMFKLYNTPSQSYISISKNQRSQAPDLAYAGTVYNGINLKDFEFSATHGDYLLSVGRIVPEKGVREAIAVAKKTNHKLYIVGPVYNDTRHYFEKYVKPELNDQIVYLGYLSQDQVIPYYLKAKALLMPIQWEEPFGLTMTEAMACGTPVIAFRRGSAPEVVLDGKTGYIVSNVGQMAKAVEKISQLKRQDCRDHVAKNFSHETMSDGYETAFKHVLSEKT